MKKVLIISYYFNQRETIGSVRLRGLVKYLPEFGWKPTILTIRSDSKSESIFRVIETEYSDLRIKWKSKIGFDSTDSVKDQLKIENKKAERGLTDFLIAVWTEIFAYPDAEKNWYNPAVEVASELLEHEHFDAILSSSAPVTCHLIANELKKRYKIPWLADFRDLWTQNHYYKHFLFRRIIEKRLEIKTMKSADVLTTVTPPFAEKLGKLHNNTTAHVIPNGFDPDVMNMKGEPLSKIFNITYTGVVYNEKQDPKLLLKAIKELISEGIINKNEIKVDFYGPNKDLEIDIKNYGLQNIVEVHNFIKRSDVIKKQKKSQILLLLNWNDSNENGVCPGKIFEYLAAKRPIISTGTNAGVVKKLLTETNAGVHVSNLKETKEEIKRAYDQFKLNGYVEYKGIPQKMNKYNHRFMAQKFANLLAKLAH